MTTLSRIKTTGQKIISVINGEDIVAYGYQLAFALLTASFPFIIFLFTLLGYTSLDPETLLNSAAQYLPQKVFDPIADIVLDVVGKQHGAILSFSIILALWSASAGFRTLMLGLDKAFGIEDRRPIWGQFLVALIGVVAFSALLILAMLALVFGGMILDGFVDFFDAEAMAGPFRTLVTFIGPVLLILFTFLLLYRFLPSKPIPWSKALFAGVFSTLVWTLFTIAFRYYVTFFIDYSRFYGVLGSLVGLIFWLLATSLILLIGAVVANEIPFTKKLTPEPSPDFSSLKGDDRQDDDHR